MSNQVNMAIQQTLEVLNAIKVTRYINAHLYKDELDEIVSALSSLNPTPTYYDEQTMEHQMSFFLGATE